MHVYIINICQSVHNYNCTYSVITFKLDPKAQYSGWHSIDKRIQVHVLYPSYQFMSTFHAKHIQWANGQGMLTLFVFTPPDVLHNLDGLCMSLPANLQLPPNDPLTPKEALCTWHSTTVHDQGGETGLLNKHSIVAYQEPDITNRIHIYSPQNGHSKIKYTLYTQGMTYSRQPI